MTPPTPEQQFSPGDMVTLWGTLGRYMVLDGRPSHHGIWWRFRCLDFGNVAEGYDECVRFVTKAVQS